MVVQRMFRITWALLLIALLAVPCSGEVKMKAFQRMQYQADDTDILNPERGFHKNADLIQGEPVRLNWVREQGCTLVRSYVQLDAFRDRPLTPEFLAQLRAGLERVREAGLKVLPIFSYNFPTDADIQANRLKQAPDAPLPIVLEHLRQLKPVLTENEDIIAALELGFVGAWGEWHSSANGLDSPAKKKTIQLAILRALPKSRMMQLRYPADLMALYPQPLTAKQGGSGTRQARTGWANMCFLSNESDSGTYLPIETKSAKQAYMEKMSAYVIVGGETCQITPGENRTDCPNAMAEMARFHYSYLNLDFFAPAIAKWEKEGCLPTIRQHLGYRLRLTEATLPRTGRPGDSLQIQLGIVNDGWAAPYNPRAVEIVLRAKADGTLHRLPLKVNPRQWQPSPEARTITTRMALPADLPEGEYDLLLNLPDPLPSLHDRPEYSIHLANRDLWEPQTGFNHLNATIQVLPPPIED